MAVGASVGKTLVVGRPGGVPASRGPLAAPIPLPCSHIPVGYPVLGPESGLHPLSWPQPTPSLF